MESSVAMLLGGSGMDRSSAEKDLAEDLFVNSRGPHIERAVVMRTVFDAA